MIYLCNLPGIGETYFSLALSTSLAPIGPSYKAASVKVFNELVCPVTYLNARRDGSLDKIGGQTILNDIENVVCGLERDILEYVCLCCFIVVYLLSISSYISACGWML